MNLNLAISVGFLKGFISWRVVQLFVAPLSSTSAAVIMISHSINKIDFQPNAIKNRNLLRSFCILCMYRIHLDINVYHIYSCLNLVNATASVQAMQIS